MLHFDGIHTAERKNVSSIVDISTLILEWACLSDLYYKYLVKAFVYNEIRFPGYRDR